MARRGKTKQDLQRRPACKTPRKRVLIVTEGSKTEPAYFRALIKNLGLTTATVSIAGEGGSAPISVVEHAQNLFKKDDDFEIICLVFDKDQHESYDRAIEQARRWHKNVRADVIIATSVPSVELWYFLHVCDNRRPYGTARDLIADMQTKAACFTAYDKSCCTFFGDIDSNRATAKTRAAHFIKQAQQEGGEEHQENPSTRVYLVVEQLEQLARDQED